jgi:uncharacterized protein YqhQ
MKKKKVGGQAVIEGVMMISPENVSIAVRKPDGNIKIDKHKRNEMFRKTKFYKLFFVRGIVSLIEMLYEGIRGINYSATVAMEKELSEKSKKSEGFLSGLFSFIGIVAAFFIFLFLPIFIASKIGLDTRPVLFNIFTGAMRITFFIIYIVAISFIPDIKRLFQYHGAEHKSVFCWEDDKELNVENCSNYSTKHPRCGTSFIFVVLIVAIIFFAIIDTILFGVLGIPTNKLLRFFIHLLVLPFLVGISYEIIRFAGNHKENRFLRIFLSPGLAFQYITTSEPDADQLRVGIAALKSALDIESSEEKKEEENRKE